MSADRTNIVDETPKVSIGEPGGVGGTYTITQIINEVPNYINQGIETLTASTPANITFTVELSDVNYTLIPRFAVTTANNRIVSVLITNKATTGFTVEAQYDCEYEWVAIKI